MSNPTDAELDAEAQQAADDAAIGVGITLLAAIGMIIYSAQKISNTSSVKRHQWAELLTCMAHTTSYTICLNASPSERTYTVEKEGKVIYEVYHNYNYSPSWYFRPFDSPFDSFKVQAAKHFPLGRIMALGSGSFIGDKATIYIRKDILTRFIVFSLGDGLEYHWTYPSRYLERIYTIVSNGALQLIRQRIGYMTTLSDTSYRVSINNNLFPSELAILTCFFGIIASPTFLKAPGPLTIVELATPFPWNMYRICGIDSMESIKTRESINDKTENSQQVVSNDVPEKSATPFHASRHWRLDETVSMGDSDYEKHSQGPRKRDGNANFFNMRRPGLSKLAAIQRARAEGSQGTPDKIVSSSHQAPSPAITSEGKGSQPSSKIMESVPIDDDEEESYVEFKNVKPSSVYDEKAFLQLTEEPLLEEEGHYTRQDEGPKVAERSNLKPRRKEIGKVVKGLPKRSDDSESKDISLLDLSVFSESDLRSAVKASNMNPQRTPSSRYSRPLSPTRIHVSSQGNTSPYDPLRKLSNQLKREAFKDISILEGQQTRPNDEEGEGEVKAKELL